MKLSCKFTSISLICLSFSLFACTNDENRIHSAEPAKEIPLEDYASIADSTLHQNVTIYRIQEFNGDTSEWNASDCNVKDSSFSCRRVTNYDCDQVYDRVLYCKDAYDNPIECPGYKDTIYDTTYQNLNFGKEALVHYIPIAKIPTFKRDSVAKLFSKISGNPCSILLSFSSNYYLEAIGLPDSLTLNLEREYIPEE